MFTLRSTVSSAYHSARAWARFLKTAREYAAASSNGDFPLRVSKLRPIVNEYRQAAGDARGHYFFQDLWAARKIYDAQPREHTDIGSRVDGFIAHLLVFMPVRVVDIRPLKSTVTGLTFVCADATDLREFADDSVESLSSLHAIEHFGLGRYGDPVSPNAYATAMSTLARVLRPGGRLYFSVPIGIERLEFNAHRVLSPQRVLRIFQSLELISFCAVDDAGDFLENIDPGQLAGSNYSCGLFEFTKDNRAS
jgi:SAM-dependent methyltransferase